ncbi:putative long-chain-fatty-acid--CoA ligase [Rosa chinensis]|uniref:Putative long-chain-fatty-acid--CoA ligase n=1 Tax=Rosa chinensis TaxID=74649 RepID=A0A2P6PNE5_ROSCH|nr:putative long-chain-fatty-acid--CoA ligase [Rosa chinensis]
MFLALKTRKQKNWGILLFVGGILSVDSDCELPPKQRTAVCTIMYTSGTTGEPKSVIVSNAALMSEVLYLCLVYCTVLKHNSTSFTCQRQINLQRTCFDHGDLVVMSQKRPLQGHCCFGFWSIIKMKLFPDS